MTVPSGAMTTDTGPLTLRTDDGETLEAEWSMPVDATPIAVVALCHPHPAQGGDMRSLVTSELFRSLPAQGIATLRFNFRGVGGSTGEHGGGTAEINDVAAAVAVAGHTAGDLGVPLVLSGWSFGADVSLAVVDPAISGWFAVAPPLRILATDAYLAATDRRPKHLAVPEHDEFNPPERCARKIASWDATTLDVIAGADHFLVGRTARLTEDLVGFAASLSG